MRLKKPMRVSIEQVRITREGNNAIVDHADPGISGAHLAIGPEIAAMSDADIAGGEARLLPSAQVGNALFPYPL